MLNLLIPIAVAPINPPPYRTLSIRPPQSKKRSPCCYIDDVLLLYIVSVGIKLHHWHKMMFTISTLRGP